MVGGIFSVRAGGVMASLIAHAGYGAILGGVARPPERAFDAVADEASD